MSRVGKNAVEVPSGVTLNIDGLIVSAKGKLGELTTKVTDDVSVTQEDNLVWVKPLSKSKQARQMWGTARANIANIVAGVSEGFSRDLDINGVGYRAQVQGNDLVLQLGFSHEVRYAAPDGIKFETPEQGKIRISGFDKQKIGQVASEIRGYRPPEPYKGKGVKYADEYILRKEGKKK